MLLLLLQKSLQQLLNRNLFNVVHQRGTLQHPSDAIKTFSTVVAMEIAQKVFSNNSRSWRAVLQSCASESHKYFFSDFTTKDCIEIISNSSNCWLLIVSNSSNCWLLISNCWCPGCFSIHVIEVILINFPFCYFIFLIYFIMRVRESIVCSLKREK